jgi:hypothetical protein
LFRILNAVQSKLEHLEEENGISRRRVRELELELEVCRRDVARERTRVLAREEITMQQQRDASYIAAPKKNKGKARAKDPSVGEDLHEKYREAVEEKKGSQFVPNRCCTWCSVCQLITQRWRLSLRPYVHI